MSEYNSGMWRVRRTRSVCNKQWKTGVEFPWVANIFIFATYSRTVLDWRNDHPSRKLVRWRFTLSTSPTGNSINVCSGNHLYTRSWNCVTVELSVAGKQPYLKCRSNMEYAAHFITTGRLMTYTHEHSALSLVIYMGGGRSFSETSQKLLQDCTKA